MCPIICYTSLHDCGFIRSTCFSCITHKGSINITGSLEPMHIILNIIINISCTHSLSFSSLHFRSVTSHAVPKLPLPNLFSTLYRFASTRFFFSGLLSCFGSGIFLDISLLSVNNFEQCWQLCVPLVCITYLTATRTLTSCSGSDTNPCLDRCGSSEVVLYAGLACGTRPVGSGADAASKIQSKGNK